MWVKVVLDPGAVGDGAGILRAASWLFSTTGSAGAGQRGWFHGSTGGQTAPARSRPAASASSVVSGRRRLRVGWPLLAGLRGPLRRGLLRRRGKRGRPPVRRCSNAWEPCSLYLCRKLITAWGWRPVHAATCVALVSCAMSWRARKRSRLRICGAVRGRQRRSANVWPQRS